MFRKAGAPKNKRERERGEGRGVLEEQKGRRGDTCIRSNQCPWAGTSELALAVASGSETHAFDSGSAQEVLCQPGLGPIKNCWSFLGCWGQESHQPHCYCSDYHHLPHFESEPRILSLPFFHVAHQYLQLAEPNGKTIRKRVWKFNLQTPSCSSTKYSGTSMERKDNRHITIMERAFYLKSEDLKPSPYLILSMLFKLPDLTEPQLSC